MDLEIIYEDSDLIVCRKPAGIATQTKRLGQQDMESLLKNYRAKKHEPPYIGVVHRLDQPVEGVMVFAKTPKAAAGLSQQIRERIIGKHYYAISAYAPKIPAGTLTDYLVTDKKTNYTLVVEPDVATRPADARKAILDYEVVAEEDGKVTFDILLHTGRQHQIRVQMAHMGCPLMGDSKYGEAGDAGRHLALCSYRLEFSHPITGKPMDFRIEPRLRA